MRLSLATDTYAARQRFREVRVPGPTARAEVGADFEFRPVGLVLVLDLREREEGRDPIVVAQLLAIRHRGSIEPPSDKTWPCQQIANTNCGVDVIIVQ